MVTDDSGRCSMISNRTVSKCEYVMTPIQRDWYLSSAICDYRKMSDLLKENPDLVNWKSYIDGNAALHYAAKFGECGVIRLLAGNHKADVHVQNHAGLTPLHMAAAGAHNEAIHLLRSVYNARSDFLDYQGHPPSYYLPNNKTGQALKRYFKDHLVVLLAQQDTPLRLLLTERPPASRVGLAAHRSVRAQRNGETAFNQQGRQLFVNRLPFNQSFPWESAASGDGVRPTASDRPISPDSQVSCTPLLPRRLLNSSLVMRIRGRSVDSVGTRDRSRSSSRQRRAAVQGNVSSFEKELHELILRHRPVNLAEKEQQSVRRTPSTSSAHRGIPSPRPNWSDCSSLCSTPSSPNVHI